MQMFLPFFTIAALLVTSASAQEGSYAGTGEGDLVARISHVDADIFDIDISISASMENGFLGCAGGITGQALLEPQGSTFWVENEYYDLETPDSGVAGEPLCSITMAFDGDKLILSEQDGRLAYHGASCGFTGELGLQAIGKTKRK